MASFIRFYQLNNLGEKEHLFQPLYKTVRTVMNNIKVITSLSRKMPDIFARF
jgi:hypothetical protein